MGRIGRGPLKGVKNNYSPANTTVVVLVCIPNLEDYYKQRFEILKYTIASILKHSGNDFDLMVIDNNSHPMIREYLSKLNHTGYIDYFIQNSQNLGLSGALNIAFNAAPGKYIAFCNDDVFFHPHWLSKHLKVLETFPNTGLVSGQTISGPDRQDSVQSLANYNDITCEYFQIPICWTKQFTKSIGKTVEQWLSTEWGQKNQLTYLLEKNETKAFSGKNGYAHVFRKAIIKELDCFPFETGMYAGDSVDRQFAHAVRDAGYYWLTTFDKTTEHMGNHLDKEWFDKFEKYGLTDYLTEIEEKIKICNLENVK